MATPYHDRDTIVVTWRRLIVLLPVVLLLLVGGAWYWLLHTESGARRVWQSVSSAEDYDLRVGVLSGNFGSGLLLKDFGFANESVDVGISDVELHAGIGLFPLEIEVQSLSATGMNVRIADTPQSDESTGIGQLLHDLRLPVKLIVTAAEIHDIRLTGVLEDQPVILDSVVLAGDWLDAIDIEQLRVAAADTEITTNVRLELTGSNELELNATMTSPVATARVSASGHPDSYSLSASGDLSLSGLNRLPFTITANGDTESVDVQPFVIANGDGEVSATGRIDWRDGLSAIAGIKLVSVDVDKWLIGHEDSQLVNGELNLVYDGGILGIRDSRLILSGNSGPLTIDADLDTEGSIENWSARGRIGLSTPEFPSGQVVLDGRGTNERFVVDQLAGELLGGTISGRAEFDWREALSWSASLSLENLDTAELNSDWPAILSGNVDAAGNQQPFLVSLDLSNIHGSLRSMPLDASGQIDIRDETITAAQLEIAHGGSRLSLDGQLRGDSGIEFDLLIDDVAHYTDGAAGTLIASGTAVLDAANPWLRIKAASDAISFGDYRVNDLSIEDRGTGVLNAEIKTGLVSGPSLELDRTHIRVNVQREKQILNVTAAAADVELSLSVSGILDDWAKPTKWSGQVNEFELVAPELSATLSRSTNFDIGDNGVLLEELCLAADDGAGLCSELSWSGSRGVDLRSRLESLPVNLINRIVQTNLIFDQSISGHLNWQQSPDGSIDGSAQFLMTAGTIISTTNASDQIDTEEGRLSFDVSDARLLTGEVSLPLSGIGRLEGEFDVLDVGDGLDSKLRGRLDADIPDIGLIDAMIPVVNLVSGRIQAIATIDGTVSNPVVAGDLSVSAGTANYLPIGLQLDEVELTGRMHESGDIELDGSFRAGEGRAYITTETVLLTTDVAGIDVTLRGNNLTLIDVPDINVIADTDVVIKYDGQTLELNGRVDVPHATVKPASYGVSKVSESDDVVIIAGTLPDVPTDEDDDIDLQMSGSVEVALGDDVNILLELAEADVSGTAVFTWTGGLVPIANGRYDISGQILAFGQRLEIDEGGLRFPNVPADNAIIRLRAIREIYGNTSIKYAGVLVDGPVRKPTVETFTNPLTTEERALTLLLTGSDFDYEQGAGAIDFGTYIAPKIYASYGIGLFDRDNVVRLRYDLKRGFGVTATSGSKESGLDLSYRFEN